MEINKIKYVWISRIVKQMFFVAIIGMWWIMYVSHMRIADAAIASSISKCYEIVETPTWNVKVDVAERVRWRRVTVVGADRVDAIGRALYPTSNGSISYSAFYNQASVRLLNQHIYSGYTNGSRTIVFPLHLFPWLTFPSTHKTECLSLPCFLRSPSFSLLLPRNPYILLLLISI